MKRCFSGHGRQRIVIALMVGALLLQVAPLSAQSEVPPDSPVGEQSAEQNGETLLLPFVAEGGDAPGGDPTSPPFVTASVVAEVLYHHLDITGNLAAMTDAAGAVVWRANSLPFA